MTKNKKNIAPPVVEVQSNIEVTRKISSMSELESIKKYIDRLDILRKAPKDKKISLWTTQTSFVIPGVKEASSKAPMSIEEELNGSLGNENNIDNEDEDDENKSLNSVGKSKAPDFYKNDEDEWTNSGGFNSRKAKNYVVRFDKQGNFNPSSKFSKDLHEEYRPTISEQTAIIQEMLTCAWYKPHVLDRKADIYADPQFPPFAKSLPKDDVKPICTQKGDIICVEVTQRTLDNSGKEVKKCTRWTRFENGKWECCEPEGFDWLYGKENYGKVAYDDTKYEKQEVLFLHEGGKGALWSHRLGNEHGEWQEQREKCGFHQHLRGALHLGWLGGTDGWYRVNVDWINEKKFSKVIVVADNDDGGRKSALELCRRIQAETYLLDFGRDAGLRSVHPFADDPNAPVKPRGEWEGNKFPERFDMADPFPAEYFHKSENGTFYLGTDFEDLLSDQTFLTWRVDRGDRDADGNPILTTEIGPWAEGKIVFLHGQGGYICDWNVGDPMKPEILNSRVASRCHTIKGGIQKLYDKKQLLEAAAVFYVPDKSRGIVSVIDASAGSLVGYNNYRPSRIRPIEGDAEPFLKFIREYLCSEEEHQNKLIRLICSLVARPWVKLSMINILIGPQGNGKSSVWTNIVTPLLGAWNTTVVRVEDINDEKNNGWVSGIMLICHEIESSDKFATYMKLKEVATQRVISVADKYIKRTQVVNNMNIGLCSNHEDAMPAEVGERRMNPIKCDLKRVESGSEKMKWLYWFYDVWLIREGGLGKILNYAKNYERYYEAGEAPEESAFKEHVIESAMGRVQEIVSEMAKNVSLSDAGLCVSELEYYDHLKKNEGGRSFVIKRSMIRSWMEAQGLVRHDKVAESMGLDEKKVRLQLAGINHYYMCNQLMVGRLRDCRDEDQFKTMCKENRLWMGEAL